MALFLPNLAVADVFTVQVLQRNVFSASRKLLGFQYRKHYSDIQLKKRLRADVRQHVFYLTHEVSHWNIIEVN